MDGRDQATGRRTDDIDLSRIMATLRRDSRRLIAFVISVTAAALVYALLAPPYFTSTATLYPAAPIDDSPFGQFRGIASDLGLASGGHQPDIRIPDVLKSHRLRKRTVEAMWKTRHHPHPVDLMTYWGWADRDRTSATDKATRRLDRLIHVSESTTGLIQVSVDMPEPALAKDIVAFLIESAQSYIHEEYRSSASLNRSFIEERLAETRGELREAEDSLKLFLDANRRIVDSPTLQLEYDRLVREVEVCQEVFITLRQQNEVAKIAEVRETPAINLLDPPGIPPRRSRPKRLLIVTLSLLGSLALGVGTSVARQQIDGEEFLARR